MSLNSLTKLLVIIFLPLLFIAVSCNKPTEPPPPEKYDLEIIAVDASCTEVWIDVKSPNTLLPQIFTLTENGEEKGSVTINKADTTIILENLLPKQTYKYQLKNTEHKSNETEITTLDTTSHNFTWQTFEFGQHSSSVLYDVAIIDENNIWAVGEIYMNDSNGNPDPKAFNAVHWNGNEWELKWIGNQGGWPCRTVFAFSENDVWFEGTIKWNGERYTVHQNGFPLMPNGDGWQINKMWGNSSNDLYAVGNGGNIAHWNGSSWVKIESPIGTSGTDVDLKSMSGNNNNLFISGYSLDQSTSLLLRLLNNQPVIVWRSNNSSGEEPYGKIIYSSRVIGNKLFVSSNTGIYLETIGGNVPPKFLFSSLYRVYHVTGTELNNVYTVGSMSNINHYNGISKKEIYIDLTVISPFYSADTKLNIIAACGTKVENAIFHKATITIGKRL